MSVLLVGSGLFLFFAAVVEARRKRAQLRRIAVVRRGGAVVHGTVTGIGFAMKKREGPPVFTYETSDGASVEGTTAVELTARQRKALPFGTTADVLYDPQQSDWVIPADFDSVAYRNQAIMSVLGSVFAGAVCVFFGVQV